MATPRRTLPELARRFRWTLAGLLWVTPPAALGLLPAFGRAGDGFPFQAVSRRSPVVEIYDRVKECVVNIHSEKTVGPSDDTFTVAQPAQRVNGMGTGIVIDPRGYVVTNHHVVDDVNVLKVRLADGTTLAARVVARDPENDLAILKIDAAKPLPVMPLGTSSDLIRGEPVLAIGNAFGYEHTLSTGVISALKRDVTLNKEVSYKQLIQTDAAINPGNSGGPLLNVRGELIGVNVAIRAGAHGIAFAIPVDSMLRQTAEMLVRARRVPLAHGMTLRDVVATKTDLSAATRSLTVETVEPDGPAAKAGLKPGDVLTRADSESLACVLDFERQLIDRAGGSALRLTRRRDGSDAEVALTLSGGERFVSAPAPDLIWRKLGVRVAPMQPDGVTRVNTQLRGGLTVLDVNPASAASRAGFLRGDVLIGLHNWETLSPDNVTYVLSHPDLASFTPLRFFVIRAGQVRRGWLQQLD